MKIITTSIEEQIYHEAKTNHWKFSELIRLGVLAKKENPQILKRIHELEDDKKNMENNIIRMQDKIRTLITKVEELEKNQNKEAVQA